MTDTKRQAALHTPRPKISRGRLAEIRGHLTTGGLLRSEAVDVMAELERAHAVLETIAGPDMAEHLALVAWRHDYPNRTLATDAARKLYESHYAPLGQTLAAALQRITRGTPHE